MGIKFTCPACGRPLNVKPELAGKRGRCPNCQAKIDIPSEGATTDAPTSLPTASPGPASQGAGSPGQSVPAAAFDAADFGVADEPTKTWSGPQTPVADPIAEAPSLQW